MSVATKTLPNENTQNATAYKAAIDATAAVFDRLAGAFAPHAQSTPNMTVRVDAGHLFDPRARTLTEVAAQSTATIAAPSANPRKDIVYIDSRNGTVGVATGTEAASPADPAIPVWGLPVARVTLATSTTVIANSIIDDIRNLGGLGQRQGAALDVGAGPDQLVTGAMLGSAASRDAVDTAAASYGAADAGKAVTLDANGRLPSPIRAAVVQVKQAKKTDTSSIAASTSWADVPGISYAFTPGNASNHVLVKPVVNYSCDAADAPQFRLVRGSTAIGVGDAAGSRTQVTAGMFIIGPNGVQAGQVVAEWLDEAPGAGPFTYKLQCRFASSTGNIYINRTVNDSNAAADFRAVSTLTLMEVTP